MSRHVVVIGGGAAGFFAAVTCAESLGRNGKVTLLEATQHLLAKVRVSGGGRCNVTHNCFEPAELIKKYPRGGRELLGAFHRWQPRDTLDWFAQRGVAVKAEDDGRMFPVTDDSATIVDCLQRAATSAKVEIRTGTSVKSLNFKDEKFSVHLSNETLVADRVILACGGGASAGGHALATSLGHTIEPLVPSLFTFNIKHALLADLSGLSVEDAIVWVDGLKLRERGPVLITHTGLSGPGILKLSAWGARLLSGCAYQFTLKLNFVPAADAKQVAASLASLRVKEPRKQVTTWNPFGIPSRLWERLVQTAGISEGMTWANLSAEGAQSLCHWLTSAELPVSGKSTHKEEFVTCGGVRLREVDFRTMESKVTPGLFFAGEVLDIDGVTGGFNFQAAWTTGWLAGQSAAE